MRLYEVTLAREPNTRSGVVGRRHTVEAKSAREAKAQLIRAAGWSHCMWTHWYTKVRWMR